MKKYNKIYWIGFVVGVIWGGVVLPAIVKFIYWIWS